MKKIKFKIIIITLFVLPSLSFAQQFCNVQVIVSGSDPVSVILVQDKTARESSPVINGDTIRIRDTVQKPLLAYLLISYKGAENQRWQYGIYLAPGNQTIIINRESGRGSLHVKGPQLSEEYVNLIQEPVVKCNREIMDLKNQMKRSNQDSVKLQKKLNAAIHLCFSVPRNYIHNNPVSPLDIIALTFMGKGDPTLPKPADELMALFHSLPDSTQNSAEGQAYWQNLEKQLK